MVSLTGTSTSQKFEHREASATAAIFGGTGKVRFEEIAVPEPAPDEVRFRVEGCGVCASSLPVWEGREWFEYPRRPGEPGHEAWGTIDAIGENVVNWQPGDRVACLSYHAFATHDVASQDAVVSLSELPGDLPFPGEPLACALNIFHRARIAPGETVAVVGVGFLGALLIQFARRNGANVLAVSRRPFARSVAEKCGAEAVFSMERPEITIGDIQTRTEGRGCSCVIEATGYQHSLDLASELVAERGRLVVAGFHQDGPRTVNMQSWNWRGIDVINAHERDPAVYAAGMRLAVTEVQQDGCDLTPLLTHELPFEELSNAFELARSRPDGFLKAYVTMSP